MRIPTHEYFNYFLLLNVVQIRGKDGTYDNQGYVIDYPPPSEDFKVDDFLQEIQKLKANNYINMETRAVLIYFTFYNHDMDKYFFCEFVKS